MNPRISMITLGVKNIAKSVAFYEKCFGLKQRPNENEKVAFFELNGTWLGLYGYEALADDASVHIKEPETSRQERYAGFSMSHNVSSKEEVDRVFSAAIEVGAISTKNPQDVFWGGYSGYFKDPDGYLWEIAYNPFFWIGPKD